MKRRNRLLKSILVFGIIATTITGLSAASINFSESVPTAQAYRHLTETAKSTVSRTGRVKLTKKEPDAVTFSAKGPGLSTYGPGTTVRSTGTWLTVNYFAEYGIGTKMMAQFRNSNWSMNSNMITGTFDYK